MMVYSWAETTIIALQNLWQTFLNFIPQLIGAIVVFLVGWIFAIGVGRLVTEIFRRLNLDKIFNQTGWTEALQKADLKISASAFIGGIVKWILVVVFLLVSVEILGLVQFAIFVKSVLDYLPNVIVAALIFAVTVIMVDIVEKVVRTAVEGIKIGYGQVVSMIVKWSIWIFSMLAILYQLGIARPFMETLFQGLVYTLVIAFGLSFGLGGKDVAAEILRDLKNKLK
ncbi:hypothetical protein KKA72_02915 [Patescibacteria group bacterium]|nr:hypothetical protein [Patescibacteria group bacterium]MBU1877261.1 hypothetical protein [Patescibacteria group bacterium]